MKWISRINNALESGFLMAGPASKLAGALNWASRNIFNRLGRAMLLPLYHQRHHRHGRIGDNLKLGLDWWVEVLELGLSEKVEFNTRDDPVMDLFCDA